MLPFGKVVEILEIKDLENDNSHTITVSRSGLKALLSHFIKNVDFDEKWYLDKYPDVNDAVMKGIYLNGKDHYLAFGYYEGRQARYGLENENNKNKRKIRFFI